MEIPPLRSLNMCVDICKQLLGLVFLILLCDGDSPLSWLNIYKHMFSECGESPSKVAALRHSCLLSQ